MLHTFAVGVLKLVQAGGGSEPCDCPDSCGNESAAGEISAPPDPVVAATKEGGDVSRIAVAVANDGKMMPPNDGKMMPPNELSDRNCGGLLLM